MEHIRRVRSLYKTILKLHKGLPEELQIIGNSYAKDEFKRHKKCNPAETTVFMDEWTVSFNRDSLKQTDHENVHNKKQLNKMGLIRILIRPG